ncbi:ribonuclease HI [Actinoplanes campanulatus]|uniref:Ribonuclease HI n=1 Tax=Actinoplanes campanulatus TaxID=113559 RepID=A0A7W5AKR5_9ACTN|nr:RNase H family protein [Actinoplanes campanulatus]MBB3097935.1 ribonuclease HI [Actinoplanes campanulatus]
MDEQEDARICSTCQVVTIFEAASGRWIHPDPYRAKFSRDVCDAPAPGRPAKGAERRFGRGRAYRRDRWTITGTVADTVPDLDEPIAIGTDSSYKPVRTEAGVHRPISWGFVTTSGRYGMGANDSRGSVPGRDRVLQGELRAIWWALLEVPATHPITVYTDSRDAIDLLTRWRNGDRAMPAGYTVERASGREATLVQLAGRVERAGHRLRVTWVRGHTGHPLNECADALAKLARAWADERLAKGTAEADARRAVRNALTRFAG